MIYFVDEDASQMGAWADLLAMRGHPTHIIRHAEQAFHLLKNEKDVEIAFIDVMLAGSPTNEGRRYTRMDSNDFMSTGLLLLEDLCKQNAAIFPYRAVVLSQNVDPRIDELIESAAKAHSIPYWHKDTFDDPWEFADAATTYLRGLPSKKGGTT